MAKLQPEYPSIQDGAGVRWTLGGADGGSCLSFLPGSLLAHATFTRLPANVTQFQYRISPPPNLHVIDT